MADTNTAAPAAPPATDQRNSKAVTQNIVNGMQARANGKAPAAADAPINGQQQPPVNPAAEDPNAGKEKYVVEGKEVWLTPQERTKWIQKGMAFEPRMDQLARLQQETVQLQRALLTDPGTVLSNLAKQANVPMQTVVQRILKGNASEDIKEIVGQWYYENAVEPLKMSPEQLKAREDAKWRAEHEDKEKTREADSIRQQNQQRVNQAMQQLKGFIGEAMKESGLPDNNTPLGAKMARMVADTMRVAQRQQQAITPKQAIEYVKSELKNVQLAYYDHLDPEQLVKELGPDNAEKVKQYFLKLVQNAGNAPPIMPKGKPTARVGERKTISPDDMHEYLEERKKNG